MRRLLVASIVIAALQAAGSAAPWNAADPQAPARHLPAPKPTSQIVRIDVIASDVRGRRLENLKPADFEVRDDGVVQSLESASFVKGDGRLIAVFLDEYHVSAANTARVRDSLTRLIDTALVPEDSLVVMKPLDSLFAIRLTRDRDAARAVVQGFEGRSGDFTPKTPYERNFMAGTPARMEGARAQVALSAINALAVHLGSVPDRRKTLIVVSEGMGRGERRRGLEYLPTTDTIVRSAQRANVAIYPVNPAQEPTESDTIGPLAGETTGVAIASDLDAGLRRAMDDASGYYLLTYKAERLDDGRFHPVQVQVKRPNTSLRARSGYFAPSPDDTLRASLLAQMNQPKPVVPLEPAPHASPLIRAWFGTTRGAGGKTRVTFVWEPAPRQTGERIRRVPSRVSLTALAPDNSVLFEGFVNPTAPGLIAEPVGTPAKAVFDMVPGRLRLRMSIEDLGQTVIDSDVRSVSIRDMQGSVMIGSPEVLRARNAREFRTLDTDQAVPAASREFSRMERLLVRFQAYGPADSTVSARLLSRMGPMRELPVTRADGDVNTLDVPLAGLAVGEYLIEVSISSPAGEAKDVVDFRVTT
ncbi:MAG TPA: VWA domain-containing protein [Vicinamibacterales bacterium]|jgi:VWFA-related protein